MKDRLLSEQEIENIKMSDYPIAAKPKHSLETAISKAQLAKTDKEWVEWVEYHFGESIAEYHTEVWQERKKEIEL